jgi:para-aminobenzoate synthetase component 2
MGELGAEVKVFRNDQVTVDFVAGLKPEKIMVSPGPCTPTEAGISCELIRKLGPVIPTFGVCLGHQAIGQVFGGRVVRAGRLMHGKASPIRHNGTGLFNGMPNPFSAIRYHSLLVERDSLPAVLEITADTEEGEIMGLRHREYPVVGVQFHPESILTENGMQILRNFLDM